MSIGHNLRKSQRFMQLKKWKNAMNQMYKVA
jgi:hypothetical protein